MTVVSRQFGHPRGPLGRVIGRGMARANGPFNRWVVEQIRDSRGDGGDVRVAELGPGPGVGLEALLRAFPEARVWGIDQSSAMLRQAGRRNRLELRTGRLLLLEGGTSTLTEMAPADIVMANHVLYFWHQPETELATIKRNLRPGGLLALGYQLRGNMPARAQEQFPLDGHLLYGSDEDLGRLLTAAGFGSVEYRVRGAVAAPEGRVALAAT
jgi:SAM-dependent methyltransferase